MRKAEADEEVLADGKRKLPGREQDAHPGRATGNLEADHPRGTPRSGGEYVEAVKAWKPDISPEELQEKIRLFHDAVSEVQRHERGLL